jgi:hypothetical protein
VILRVKSPRYGGIRLAIEGYHLFSTHGWEIIKMIILWPGIPSGYGNEFHWEGDRGLRE